MPPLVPKPTPHAPLQILPASRQDLRGLWDTFRRVVKDGDSHGYARDTSIEEMQQIWLGNNVVAWKAVHIDAPDKIVGTYIIRPAYFPRASTVANASYMVHPDYHRQGIGKAMGKHSLKEAKALGYNSMLFKAVVSTNTAAIMLWNKLGFTTIATVPKSYEHSDGTLVDLLVMYKAL